MKMIGLILKFAVFPLLPFFVNVLMGCIHEHAFQFSSISPTLLCFPMALLLFFLLTRSSRLEDPDLRDVLTQVFLFGAIFYFILFSSSIFLETDIMATKTEFLNTVMAKLAKHSRILVTDLPILNKKYEDLEILRWIAVGFSVMVIPLVVFTTKKYDLEKM